MLQYVILLEDSDQDFADTDRYRIVISTFLEISKKVEKYFLLAGNMPTACKNTIRSIDFGTAYFTKIPHLINVRNMNNSKRKQKFVENVSVEVVESKLNAKGANVKYLKYCME